MLTGLHQHGIESMRMTGLYPASEYDADKIPFWPSVFREKGYVTAQIGKWHTGTDAGFGRDWDFQKVWNRPKFPMNAPNYYDNQLISTNGAKEEMVKGYSTDNYTQWATEFIKGENRDEEKPWYLWLCYGAVHGPFTPAERHLENYPGIDIPTPADIYPPRKGKPKYVNDMEYWEPGKNGVPVERDARPPQNRPMAMKDLPGRPLREWVQQYHQAVCAIDEGVAKVLKALKDSGQEDNTLVIFTSDQGFAWGQHGFKSKVAPYDATVQAPLIIRTPRFKTDNTAGRVVTAPVSGVDLPITFFAQAGLELPWKMHGHDLSPLLQEKPVGWDHAAMLVHTAAQYGSDTNVVPGVADQRLYHGPGVPWYVALSEGRYKYVRTLIEGEVEELYDLEADGDELTNLALEKKHLKRLRAFRAATIKELKRVDAGFVKNLPGVGTPK